MFTPENVARLAGAGDGGNFTPAGGLGVLDTSSGCSGLQINRTTEHKLTGALVHDDAHHRFTSEQMHDYMDKQQVTVHRYRSKRTSWSYTNRQFFNNGSYTLSRLTLELAAS